MPLAQLMAEAERALAAAGVTVQDLLDQIPAARAEVVTEAYGTEFVEEIERLIAERRSAQSER